MAGQILIRCVRLIRKWQPVGINLQHSSSTSLCTRQHSSFNINKELAVTSTWFPWQPVSFAMLGQLCISPICYQNLNYEQINNFNPNIVGVANHIPQQCSSVLKKRRQKMNRHKYKKLRKKMKFLRRKLKK